MTNQERFCRHIGETEVCQVCRGGVESTLHVLRDCPAMAGIWMRIVPRGKQEAFFDMSCLEWCGNVFGNNTLWRDRVKFVKDYAKEVTAGRNGAHRAAPTNRQERLISWSPPSVGWMKLNTDGASLGNPGAATAGGVLRNGDGQWCGGFALNIGRCTAPLAELWGISDTHLLSFLVHLCHGFILKDWEVRFLHVYREANHLADGLATYAFSLPSGLHVFDLVPPDLATVLRDDVCGVAQSRQIHV
ncbi:unnamed protein product [Microthlaspi erraticum]|uniref:Uncharacterized protein n=1 Tax=Microthlaspi erraticum TaxID=1685480 RepID=A0A6D2KJG2_9BRAS|nr:unnamed protein product [Microthlaspi erraticum]